MFAWWPSIFLTTQIREEESSVIAYKVAVLARLSVFPEGVALPDNRKNVDPRKLLKPEAKNIYCSEKKTHDYTYRCIVLYICIYVCIYVYILLI